MSNFDYWFELHCLSERWLAEHLPAPNLPPPESFKTEIPYNDYDNYYDTQCDNYNFIDYTQNTTYTPENYDVHDDSDSDSDNGFTEYDNEYY